MPAKNFYEQVYAIIRHIPYGQVTTYGRIARMLGTPKAARAVGYALRALQDKANDSTYQDIPWHRVINSQGRISIVNREYGAQEQANRLKAEGISVSIEHYINLDAHLWAGLHWLELDALIKDEENHGKTNNLNRGR